LFFSAEVFGASWNKLCIIIMFTKSRMA
jgi:hypothetical protein